MTCQNSNIIQFREMYVCVYKCVCVGIYFNPFSVENV